MYPLLQRGHICKLHTYSLSFCSKLIDKCIISKTPLISAKIIHAKLIKLGFNTNTFLGNRCVDLYDKVGCPNDALKAFDEIVSKNIVSWNVCLKVFVGMNDIGKARALFDKMPERDVVSLNTMISGYVSFGCLEKALGVFVEMGKSGVRPSGYTFSILVSCVRSSCWGKELHGNMIRNGVDLCNVVVGNCLIDMYGKVGLVGYAIGVFRTMEEVDVISWNSLISVCCKLGYEELALQEFCLMRYEGYKPDDFTISAVITVCSNLQDLEKGKQTFCLSIKMGFLSNTIVSSAAIDLFSKCNRLEDSILVFDELDMWDSAVCNSMISSYARHDLEENALQLFVRALNEDFRPTEFTMSCILSCASVFFPVEVGCQLHSLVVKIGFEADSVIASSLIEMYSKSGQPDSALKISAGTYSKDLICWNTTIMGLASNGKVVESLCVFKELLESGQKPDHITMAGVLLACNNGGLLDEGMAIFSSMEEKYGVTPTDEHYPFIVSMLTRKNELNEAIIILETMPQKPNISVWESILNACQINGDLKLIERVAHKMMELEPQLYLPYLVLAQAYEQRGRWESLVRVRRMMRKRRVKEVVDCTRIGIHNRLFILKENDIFQHHSEEIYSVVRLLIQETWDGYRGYQQIIDAENVGEEG